MTVSPLKCKVTTALLSMLVQKGAISELQKIKLNPQKSKFLPKILFLTDLVNKLVNLLVVENIS